MIWQRAPFVIDHDLAGHPALTCARLADLSRSMPAGRIRRHADADLPLAHHAGTVRRLRRPTHEVITGLEGGEFAWVFLTGLDSVPDLDALAVDATRPYRDRAVDAEGDAGRRDVSAFAAAPGAVVPAHIDVHHNVLLQIRGTKDVVIGPAPAGGELEIEVEGCVASAVHNLHELPPQFETFHLRPGQGVYIPPFAPHWVVGGDGVSVSLAHGWRTVWTERERLVRYWNARQRALGWAPSSPRPTSTGDRAKVAAVRLRGRLARR